MAETHYSTIADVQTLIRDGRTSPVTMVESCLERIAELNPRLNAFVLVLADEARQQAHDAEAEIREGRWRGPLHGVPVGIKDFYDTAGHRTTAAFEPFAHRVPRADAVSVTRLKEAGAIVIGKTNMHTLGMGTTGLESAFGPARNPWHADYIPGGSSSGSAAAVAAGLCYATLDTDAIGSCRLPASCCGVVGFKGTYGLVSLDGILAGEQPPDEMIRWMSHAGITARAVEDCAIVWNALSGSAPSGSAPSGSGLPGSGLPGSAPHADVEVDADADALRVRVGVVENISAVEEVAAAFQHAVDIIRTFGWDIVSVRAPLEMPRFDPKKIQDDRRTAAERVFRDADVLILPTTVTPVLKVDEARTNAQALSPAHTIFANYLGLPAVSVPCGFDPRGLPLGLQIVGKPHDDETVLRVAHRYHSASTTRAGRRYPIP